MNRTLAWVPVPQFGILQSLASCTRFCGRKELAMLSWTFLKSGVPQLERVAIGALFGLLDYSSNLQHLFTFSPDRDLVKKIIETKQDTWSFSLAKTGCLLSLSKYPMMRSHMIELGALDYFQEDNHDILIQYLRAVGIAYLLSGNPKMDAGERQKSLEMIEKQFTKHPQEIRKKESRHGVVWSSSRHLIQLITDEEKSIRHIGLLCLSNLSYGDYNRSLMQEEKVLDAILCSQWRNDGAEEERKKGYIEVIIKNFGANTAVPSLFHISLHNILNKPSLSHLAEEVQRIL